MTCSPFVSVTNRSARDLLIDHDSNWDDQVLLINDQPVREPYRLEPNACADVRVEMHPSCPFSDYLMGVVFADGGNDDQGPRGIRYVVIGRQPETGLFGITDESEIGQPATRYEVRDETPSSMSIDFFDLAMAGAVETDAARVDATASSASST